MVYCAHEILGIVLVKVRIYYKVYCGLIDTGAQVSLVSVDFVKVLELFDWHIPKQYKNVRLNVIFEDKTLV